MQGRLRYIQRFVIDPTFASLLPARMDSAAARVMLLAIGLQESRFEARTQHGGGPARGFWQFEKGGGVAGVLSHASSRKLAHEICDKRGVTAKPAAVHPALARDDMLACAFARLLLFTDARPLPAIGDEATAWDYYIRNWQPGKPHENTWPRLYQAAVVALGSGA